MAEIAAAPIAKLGRICERYCVIMAPDAHENEEGTDRHEVSETRIALTFFGGVSLAVYETGAAVEFFRLVTGDGVYAKLREKIGPVVIDIISGTSAGALSAAFLATALINRSRSLDPLMQLWLDEADLDTLFRSEAEEEPTSLLNGEQFLELINVALQKMAGSGTASAAQHQYLDLFLTATSLEGDVREFKFERNNLDRQPSVEGAVRESDPNHINARSHQRVFHFCYRGEECAIDEERHNDFQPQRLHLIARAARASASFPLAFEPVLIKKDEFGSFSRDLVADCHYIDGGILDNKPIKLAFDAIGHRHADKQIDRRLFYVEPLPEAINFAAGAAQATPLAGKKAYLRPINVLYAAVKDLPSYQSITSALEEIVLRNHEMETLRRTLTHYENLAGKPHIKPPKSKGMAGLPRMWGPDTATASSYYRAKNIPTQLFRAQEDGYLDLRLERHFAPWFAECVKIGREIQRRSEEDGPGYLRAHAQFYYLKQNILWSCDFEYHRRQYHYLKQVVRSLFARLEKGEKHLFEGAPDLRHKIYLSLNRLRALFNKQERQIYQMQQHAQRNPAPELLPIEGLLATLRTDLEGKPKGEAKAGVALFSTRVQEMAGWAEIQQRWRFLAQLHQTAEAQLQIESARFLNQEVKEEMGNGIQAELKKGYAALDAALQWFYYRDMIIYPMMRGSEMLASELQPIRVARFGPLDANSYVNVSHPNHKMAGEEGLRFGGFMDATWRGNDLIWGRLDAVENIFHQLLPKGREDELFKTCLRDEQRRIVQEMKEKFGKGIVHPLEKQNPEGEPPHEDLLIGKQNLCNIPAEKKIRWLEMGITRLVRSIRVRGGRRRLLHLTQAGVSKIFVNVLARPVVTAIVLGSACVALVAMVSFLGALAVKYKWENLPPSLGSTGDMAAILWLLFIASISLMIALVATLIRIRFLKIAPRSAGDRSG